MGVKAQKQIAALDGFSPNPGSQSPDQVYFENGRLVVDTGGGIDVRGPITQNGQALNTTPIGNLAGSYQSIVSLNFAASYLSTASFNLAGSYVSTASFNLAASYLSTASLNLAGSYARASDLTITSATTNQMLLHNGTSFVNISHIRRAQGYVGIVEDVDSTTAFATAMAEINTAGKGWFECKPFGSYLAANIPIYTKTYFDLMGAKIKLPNSAASGSDVFRSNNYNSLLGGGTTGGVYNVRIKLNGGEIDGNYTNNANGRHGLAIYGVGSVEGPGYIHDCNGSALAAEWSGTSSELSVLGLGLGDQTFVLDGFTAYDCNLAWALSGADFNVTPAGGGAGITAVSNINNPTITTAQRHLLRLGQTITIASVNGATGVNGTWTVGSVPTATTFNITTGSPGVFSASSASLITSPRKAMVSVNGVDSPRIRDLELYQTLGMKPSSVALMLACGGVQLSEFHAYQNFACAIDIKGNSNNSQFNGVYIGGHDQALLVRQNNLKLVNMQINDGFPNSIGIDYQSGGGACHFVACQVNGLQANSVAVRIWNTSWAEWDVSVTDNGVDTFNLYEDPNATADFRGRIQNLGVAGRVVGSTRANYLA